jgi:hypothetical protein
MMKKNGCFISLRTLNICRIWRSSGQSSWLEIQRPGFISRRCQIFWVVVGLERGPFSLVSTIEKVLERKSSGSFLENRDYGRRDSSRWPCGTISHQKLTLTSLRCGGRSVRSRTQATEFIFFSLVWFQGLAAVVGEEFSLFGYNAM